MSKDEPNIHYRQAFDSPYLSAADLEGPINLTIKRVELEPDHSHRSSEPFNTAYFVEEYIREGQKLKPMILNAGNCEFIKKFAKSSYIKDWKNIEVTIYVVQNVKRGSELVDGLRISPEQPSRTKREITPNMAKPWASAIESYKRYGNLDSVLKHADISLENQQKIIKQAEGND